ncbi:MAG: DUF4185 domain-containing protein [Anaerolineaceae bacterium]|nr:DUF4185 domain-containing protein [Anaerolineaceae bacterium]
MVCTVQEEKIGKGITRRDFMRSAVLFGAAALSQGCNFPLTRSTPARLNTATAKPDPLSPTAIRLPTQPADSTAAAPAISYIPGASQKLEQLIGDEDKQLHQPTLSRTFTRFGITGTDMGYSFENQGLVYFLFGDTLGKLDRALDVIATTDALDPEKGVHIDFLMEGANYLTIQPPGISMGAFETPVGGISLGGQMYVVVRTNHSADWSTDRSVLTRFNLPASFQPLRIISQAPAGRFISQSLHIQPDPIAGLPEGGPFVIVWGTGHYRQSDAYLSIVPAANFEGGQRTLYFAGMNEGGLPEWSANEADAQPVVKNGTMGDISVTWCRALTMWLMTFDSRPPAAAGIQFCYSKTPWGPWSQAQTIFNAQSDGAMGNFIHDPKIKPDDGLEGPVIGAGQANPAAVAGGAYAPYVVERWTKVQGSELDLYYLLSTWNPYTVVLMKSRFEVA